MDELYEFTDPDDPELEPLRVVGDDDPEMSDRWVPLFSQVRGGPETCMLFCARPMVPGREALRTVPKSQRSSGSPLEGLQGESVTRQLY
jgi:hypothetical protein